uniref:EF-hand domain-containing protein n=1 Tax=Noctiluca scintillans TaxID=2966 RepID=A0A7S0ZUV4_NOCSC|mmetsp:Transcript_1986/g.5647  ORF Transcript_1986/g.5647 Transcript_1986/m.5647 type:complete len:1103 (+) Transcript_1986:258-3566(+)
MASSAGKAKSKDRRTSLSGKEPREPEPEVDVLRTQVDSFLKSSGANGLGLASSDRCATMEALLKQYTFKGSLAMTNEEGEHLLHPQGYSNGERPVRSRQPGGDSSNTIQPERERKSTGRDLLQHLDSEGLMALKDCFRAHGDELDPEQFTSLTWSCVGHVEGRDERHFTARLQELYAQLTDEAESLSWSAFARYLLEEGVVSEKVRHVNMVKILSHIELENIATLAEYFRRDGGSLHLEQFVMVMKSLFHHLFDLTALFHCQEEERQLVAQIVSLFQLIDINGEGTLSWEKFTTFLVDQGMVEDIAREFNIIRFRQNSLVRDDMPHQSHMEKAFYCSTWDKIAFIEQGAKCLKLCTPDLVPYREIRDIAQPLCVEYIEKYKYLMVSCSDQTLSFFDVDNGLKLLRRFETKTAQIVMCWSVVAQAPFTADYEGRIFAWDMELVRTGVGKGEGKSEGGPWDNPYLKAIPQRHKADTVPMRHIKPEEPDTRVVRRGNPRVKATDPDHPNSGGTIATMLLELPVLQQMASCGVDRNVMIWDVTTGLLRQLLEGHQMGVRCMAFAASNKVLVTGGFDYNLFVWNPYVGTSTHVIRGHVAPIVGIEVLGAASNQIVSADSEGVLKTWDLGTYQLIQNIIVDGLLSLRVFVSVPTHKRIFAADRKFIAYDYQNAGVADQTDDAPILKATFHHLRRVFFTACTTHLRIWDAVTGGIKCMIPHRDAEIISFSVDDRGQKVFVGDHDGEIWVYNSTTGCVIKKMTAHSKEVSGLLYCGDRNVISVSWDTHIFVHDESSETPRLWRSAKNVHHGDITCVAFSRHLGLVATGSIDCVISVREYERLRPVSSLLGHKSEILALAFVEPFPLLASTDAGGNVAIWMVPFGARHKHDNKVLIRFINTHSLEHPTPVGCLAPLCEADSERFLMYAGDESGELRVWDFSAVLTAGNVVPSSPKSEWEPHKVEYLQIPPHITASVAKKAAALETPELPACLSEKVVQMHSWRAHTEGIRSIEVCSLPACCVTAGSDHMVKVWSRHGELLTVLRAYGQTHWNFPMKAETFGVDVETLSHVLRQVGELEKRKSRPPVFLTQDTRSTVGSPKRASKPFVRPHA